MRAKASCAEFQPPWVNSAQTFVSLDPTQKIFRVCDWPYQLTCRTKRAELGRELARYSSEMEHHGDQHKAVPDRLMERQLFR